LLGALPAQAWVVAAPLLALTALGTRAAIKSVMAAAPAQVITRLETTQVLMRASVVATVYSERVGQAVSLVARRTVTMVAKALVVVAAMAMGLA
jgi:hypothetical protein